MRGGERPGSDQLGGHLHLPDLVSLPLSLSVCSRAFASDIQFPALFFVFLAHSDRLVGTKDGQPDELGELSLKSPPTVLDSATRSQQQQQQTQAASQSVESPSLARKPTLTSTMIGKFVGIMKKGAEVIGGQSASSAASTASAITTLLAACEVGDVEATVRIMHDPLVNVNEGTADDTTPLFVACERGFLPVIQELLDDMRVDVNKARQDGATPFSIACQEGNVEVVRLLRLDQRVNVNKARQDGSTPFLLACGLGNTEVVKHLLTDPRVDVNTPQIRGATPLLIACLNGHASIFKWILASGREIALTTSWKSQTVHDIARLKGSAEAIEALEEYESSGAERAIVLSKEKLSDSDISVLLDFCFQNHSITRLR